MMNFTGVKAITIPEGSVAKIMRGAELLWEKPGSGGLPAGWTMANFVRFTGAQHIDTGIVPTQKTRIEITLTRESSEGRYLYGVRNSGNTASVTAYLSSNGAWRFGNTYRNFTLTVDKEYTMAVDRDGVDQNGTHYNYGTTVKSFTANGTLTLGSTRSTSGGLGSPHFVGTVKEFRMYNDGELVLELLPVYNAATGTYAFYDAVAGVLKPSMTTTAFQGG
jgi:hypothetical protein